MDARRDEVLDLIDPDLEGRADARAVRLPDAGPVGRRDGHRVRDLAVIIGRSPGLRWKIWTENETEQTGGGIYLFEDDESARAYVEEHGPARRLRRNGHPRAALRRQRAAHGDDARAARRRVTTTLELGQVTDGVRLASTPRSRASGSRTPTPRASSTTAATSRTSTARAPNATGTWAASAWMAPSS